MVLCLWGSSDGHLNSYVAKLKPMGGANPCSGEWDESTLACAKLVVDLKWPKSKAGVFWGTFRPTPSSYWTGGCRSFSITRCSLQTREVANVSTVLWLFFTSEIPPSGIHLAVALLLDVDISPRGAQPTGETCWEGPKVAKSFEQKSEDRTWHPVQAMIPWKWWSGLPRERKPPGNGWSLSLRTWAKTNHHLKWLARLTFVKHTVF